MKRLNPLRLLVLKRAVFPHSFFAIFTSTTLSGINMSTLYFEFFELSSENFEKNKSFTNR